MYSSCSAPWTLPYCVFSVSFFFISVRLHAFICGYSGFLDLSVDLWQRTSRLVGVLWPSLRYLATVICAIGLSLFQGNILNFCHNFLPFFRSSVGNLNYYYFLGLANVAHLTDFLTLHTGLLVLWHYITVASGGPWFATIPAHKVYPHPSIQFLFSALFCTLPTLCALVTRQSFA